MSRVVFGACLFALIGCAGGASSRPAAHAGRGESAAATASRATDEALALLAELPAGAERCVVALPSRVDAAQRALVPRVSQAEPLAWLPELEVLAYASVERADRDGRAARTSVLSTALPQDRARAVLQARAGVALDFSASPAPCSDAACPVRARFTGPHRVRLERGDFAQSRQSGPGIEALCRTRLEQRRDAVEASALRGGGMGDLDLSGLPLRSSTQLTQGQLGLHVLRVDRLASELEADATLENDAAGGMLLGPALANGSNVRRERRGATLRTEFDVLWEDLELARDDDAREQAVEREADALGNAVPAAGAQPVRREDVLGQVGYLIDQAHRSAAHDRQSQLLAARAVLEHALAQTPDDEGFALALCELLLAELRDVEAALQIAQRFAAQPHANGRFAAFARNAAALISAEALAGRLLADGLAKRRDAPALASDILARMGQGASYDLAERTAIDARK